MEPALGNERHRIYSLKPLTVVCSISSPHVINTQPSPSHAPIVLCSYEVVSTLSSPTPSLPPIIFSLQLCLFTYLISVLFANTN